MALNKSLAHNLKKQSKLSGKKWPSDSNILDHIDPPFQEKHLNKSKHGFLKTLHLPKGLKSKFSSSASVQKFDDLQNFQDNLIKDPSNLRDPTELEDEAHNNFPVVGKKSDIVEKPQFAFEKEQNIIIDIEVNEEPSPVDGVDESSNSDAENVPPTNYTYKDKRKHCRKPKKGSSFRKKNVDTNGLIDSSNALKSHGKKENKDSKVNSHPPIMYKKSLMLCDFCLMTVSAPALYASNDNGKGREIIFRFSPLAKIGLIRAAILREFLERSASAPHLLSTLHLCYYNDKQKTWEWLEENLPLFVYNLQRECRVELKAKQALTRSVRVVLPDVERTMTISYDQFSLAEGVLARVIDAQKRRINDMTGFSLFHVRLRFVLDPSRSMTHYEFTPQDTLECRVASGKLECTTFKIKVPQTGSVHLFDICLDQTVGDLISLLVKQLTQSEVIMKSHSALYRAPNEQRGEKGVWLDDYKFLYTYQLDDSEVLEFRARYRPLTFDMRVYYSYENQRRGRQVTLMLSQNIIVQQVIEMLHAISQLEFDCEQYGLYQHTGDSIPNDIRLWEFLDNISNKRYEDTVRLQMIPMYVNIVFSEEVSTEEIRSKTFLVDFSRPCIALRDMVSRTLGVRNSANSVLYLNHNELDLQISLFNNGVRENSILEFVWNNSTTENTSNIWTTDHDDTSCIQYNEEGTKIEAATFNKLIIQLTSSHDLDPEFVKTFLLTYRAYTSPQVLLQKLIERYHVVRPFHQDVEEFIKFRTTIQLRVINAIRLWLELGLDFQDDTKLQNGIMEFIEDVLYDDQPKTCKRPRNLLLKIQNKITVEEGIKTTVNPPPSKMPKDYSSVLGISDIDPIEIARQLTLIDYEIFQQIKPWELLNRAWRIEDQEKSIGSKNIRCLIDRLNNMTLWVASTILSNQEDYQRAKEIANFVKIAHNLRKMHNLSTFLAIIGGVDHGSITRLYRTWSKVDKNTIKMYEELLRLCDPTRSNRNMREELSKIEPPCLPPIGVIMNDIALIDEVNPNLMHDGLINYYKCTLMYTKIRDFTMYQQRSYNFRKVPEVHSLLSSFQFVDSKTAYEHSERYEPRIKKT